MKFFYILLFFAVHPLFGQNLLTPPESEAKVTGGKEAFQQVLETQLTLPKVILNSNFDKDLIVFFDLDSAGKAIHLKFQAGTNNILRNELTRIFKFLSFERTQSVFTTPLAYWISFKLSTDKYFDYYKQKTKLKLKAMPADSSFLVYTKSDRSPDYFKNGEEGMGEFVLSEIEYPKLAIDKTIEGTVLTEFVVETNGYVTALRTVQGVNGGCSEEAARIIRKTRWQPAQLNGKYVRYKTTYPITFSLRNVNKDGTSTIGQ